MLYARKQEIFLMAEDKTHRVKNPVAALRCSINTIYGDKMRRISVCSVLLASSF
jgi:hypothetical protein